jgi:glycine cleavage system regulatory protein
MSRLGGTFAIIMLVSLKGNQFSEFQKQISAAFPDFQIHSTLTESQKAVLEDPSTAPYEVCFLYNSFEAS